MSGPDGDEVTNMTFGTSQRLSQVGVREGVREGGRAWEILGQSGWWVGLRLRQVYKRGKDAHRFFLYTHHIRSNLMQPDASLTLNSHARRMLACPHRYSGTYSKYQAVCNLASQVSSLRFC